ncbi:hypothetical protein GUJ93_ZPchr0006g44676 [Zizania palustris]|uniref:Uncharacterized protein n=1 Tax=Zizania palustris TaxID=103762 RepID=A0A8J5SQ45_ZIZPA|nr:hypothetical protein GUJ93_ZPchr0006g44676 [Zizania palustris]
MLPFPIIHHASFLPSLALRAHPAPCFFRASKSPIPRPSRPFSLPRRLAGSLRPWLDRCPHALMVAAISLALALSSPLPLFPAHAAASVAARPKPKAPYPCEDVGRYYEGADVLAGNGLMAKLRAVVSPHAALRYKDVWDALKILDAADAEHPEASSDMYDAAMRGSSLWEDFYGSIEIYSQRAVPKILAGKPDGWNREHLWPRSYGLTYGPSLTDLHNIRAADVNVNSSRGNKYYGQCAATSTRCVRPANLEAAPDTETDSERWAPPLKVRGDIARSLMYMAVTYGSDQKDGAPHLELSDTPSIRK